MTKEIIKDYAVLAKLRLSLLTSFSGLFGYALATKATEWTGLIFIFLAGFLISASAGTFNEILEIKTDALMDRTKNRPLPAGRLTKKQAVIFGLITLVLSLIIFVTKFNLNAAIFSVISWALYSFAYTPLKKKGIIAVFVGAIPGAFPPFIGWLAATNQFGLEPGILFAIQFFWQFPHFWAVAWVAHDDYKKAGFRLLPGNGEQDVRSAVQAMIYTLFLIPLCWVPYFLGMTGIISAFIATVASVLFLAQTLNLIAKVNKKAALQLMFGSFLFLPIVQIAYFLDKIK